MTQSPFTPTQYDDAVTVYTDAIRRCGHRLHRRNSKMQSPFTQTQYEDAVTVYTDAIRKTQSPFTKTQYEDAVTVYKDAIQRHSDFVLSCLL